MNEIGRRMVAKLDKVDKRSGVLSGDAELAEALTTLQRVSDSSISKKLNLDGIEVKLTGIKATDPADGYPVDYTADRLSLHRNSHDEISLRVDYTQVGGRNEKVWQSVTLAGRSSPHATPFYPDAPTSYSHSYLFGKNSAEALRPFLADLLTQLEARIP